MPMYDKLKVGLENDVDCSAYCCQCCWVSCSDEKKVKDVVNCGGTDTSGLKWVCAGH